MKLCLTFLLLQFQVSFEAALTERTYLPTHTKPCVAEPSVNNPEILNCFHRHLEKAELGCRLPWNHQHNSLFEEVCNGTDHYTKLEEHSTVSCPKGNVRSMVCMIIDNIGTCNSAADVQSDGREVHSNDGMPSRLQDLHLPGQGVLKSHQRCAHQMLHQISAVNIYSDKFLPHAVQKNQGVNLEISLFFSRSVIPMEKEVYLYDALSFFGEVGGYGGLFLGISLLSIYETVQNAVIRFFQRIRLPPMIQE